MNQAYGIVLIAIPIIIAITLHEAAHGYVALHFGDDTALKKGRITLNPFKHIDLFGTILLPLFLLLSNVGFVFGYAKPVPVNPNALMHPRRDMVWVAAAGPALNILLALVSTGLAYGVVSTQADFSQLAAVLLFSVRVNLLLAFLNLVPLPPLDGSKVALGLLPLSIAKRYARLSRFGFLIVIIVLVVLPPLGTRLGIDLNLFGWLVGGPVNSVMHIVNAVVLRR